MSFFAGRSVNYQSQVQSAFSERGEEGVVVGCGEIVKSNCLSPFWPDRRQCTLPVARGRARGRKGAEVLRCLHWISWILSPYTFRQTKYAAASLGIHRPSSPPQLKYLQRFDCQTVLLATPRAASRSVRVIIISDICGLTLRLSLGCAVTAT